jgi:hypothetical protein
MRVKCASRSIPKRSGVFVRCSGKRVACVPTLMLQPARLPLQKNKMLLLFPEQNETAATINQCVVFRINFGPHAYSI